MSILKHSGPGKFQFQFSSDLISYDSKIDNNINTLLDRMSDGVSSKNPKFLTYKERKKKSLKYLSVPRHKYMSLFDKTVRTQLKLKDYRAYRLLRTLLTKPGFETEDREFKFTKEFSNIPFSTKFNMLRRERLYTKLKYSRTPAFDIVSGGAAALLAGLIGFLVCEKFGLELLDSGDFYTLFMFIIFASALGRVALQSISLKDEGEGKTSMYLPGFIISHFVNVIKILTFNILLYLFIKGLKKLIYVFK